MHIAGHKNQERTAQHSCNHKQRQRPHLVPFQWLMGMKARWPDKPTDQTVASLYMTSSFYPLIHLFSHVCSSSDHLDPSLLPPLVPLLNIHYKSRAIPECSFPLSHKESHPLIGSTLLMSMSCSGPFPLLTVLGVSLVARAEAPLGHPWEGLGLLSLQLGYWGCLCSFVCVEMNLLLHNLTGGGGGVFLLVLLKKKVLFLHHD